jgi:hypothetical protein
LSPDPIGLAGGEPGYFAYVNSNSITAADPRGLAEITSISVTDSANSESSPIRTPGYEFDSLSLSSDAVDIEAMLIAYATRPHNLDPNFDSAGCQRVSLGSTPYTFNCTSFPNTMFSAVTECDELLGTAGGTDVKGGCAGGIFMCEVCSCPYLRDMRQWGIGVDENGDNRVDPGEGVVRPAATEPVWRCTNSGCVEKRSWGNDDDGILYGTTVCF